MRRLLAVGAAAVPAAAQELPPITPDQVRPHLEALQLCAGLNDDGSGIAGLLAIAGALGATPTRDTVRLGFGRPRSRGSTAPSAT